MNFFPESPVGLTPTTMNWYVDADDNFACGGWLTLTQEHPNLRRRFDFVRKLLCRQGKARVRRARGVCSQGRIKAYWETWAVFCI